MIAITGDILAVAVRADLPAVPEMNALIPIAALLVVLGATGVWQKRRRLA